MFFFTDEERTGEGPVKSLTTLDVDPNSSLNLQVMRGASPHFPKQTAKIVVDSEKSTAVMGTDFTLSETAFKFNGRDDFYQPFVLDVKAASGKKIVLRIDYEYYKESPVDEREKDELTINVK